MTVKQEEVFTIGKPTISGDLVTFAITVNSESKILGGHFPGQPVVPGACMLQLVKDALEIALKSKLHLKKAALLKFLRPVIPQDGLPLRLLVFYKLDHDADYALKASLTDGDATYFKLQGIFTGA